MRILPLIAALLVLAESANAQAVPDTFNLQVSKTAVALIERGLMKLPYEDVAELLVAITTQVRDQIQKPPPETTK